MHWFQLHFGCTVNSDLGMYGFLFIYCLASLLSQNSSTLLYPNSPCSPHSSSLYHILPLLLHLSSPTSLLFVVVVLGAGRVVFLMRLFLPLYSPQTGLHPGSLSAGFCEKEKQEEGEEEEGMGRTSILWTLTHVVSAYLFFNFIFIIDTNTDVPHFPLLYCFHPA